MQMLNRIVGITAGLLIVFSGLLISNCLSAGLKAVHQRAVDRNTPWATWGRFNPQEKILFNLSAGVYVLVQLEKVEEQIADPKIGADRKAALQQEQARLLAARQAFQEFLEKSAPPAAQLLEQIEKENLK